MASLYSTSDAPLLATSDRQLFCSAFLLSVFASASLNSRSCASSELSCAAETSLLFLSIQVGLRPLAIACHLASSCSFFLLANLGAKLYCATVQCHNVASLAVAGQVGQRRQPWPAPPPLHVYSTLYVPLYLSLFLTLGMCMPLSLCVSISRSLSLSLSLNF